MTSRAASSAVFITALMASAVDLPALKPNWLDISPSVWARWWLSLTTRYLSCNFIVESSIQRGQKLEGWLTGLLASLYKNISLALFHTAGDIPVVMHALNVLTSDEGFALCRALITSFGTHPRPGAFPEGRRRALAASSYRVNNRTGSSTGKLSQIIGGGWKQMIYQLQFRQVDFCGLIFD